MITFFLSEKLQAAMQQLLHGTHRTKQHSDPYSPVVASYRAGNVQSDVSDSNALHACNYQSDPVDTPNTQFTFRGILEARFILRSGCKLLAACMPSEETHRCRWKQSLSSGWNDPFCDKPKLPNFIKLICNA
jgi:hypothetical protein